MVLEVRHLRIVDAIHREGTVVQAAKRLHLTQPAVSHALRDLEDRLGVRFFDRRGRKMQITAEGQRVVAAAGVVLEELRRTEHDLGQLGSGRQGTLYLTTECYTCYHWLPPVLATFQDEFPGLDLQIVPEATRSPFEALLGKRVDLAIVHSEPPTTEIATRKLFRDEVVAVVAPGHSLARKRFLTAQDFADHPLILHATGSIIVRKVLEPAGVQPPRTMVIPLTEAVLQSVRAGLGISVLARWAISPDLEARSLRAIRITKDGIHRTWSGATLRERVDAPGIKSLLEYLRANSLRSAKACACA